MSKFEPRGSLQLREKLVDHGYCDYLEAGRLEWPGNSETKEEWKERMEREGEYADHVMMQLTANVLNRDIVLHHVILWLFIRGMLVMLLTDPV